MASDRRTGWRRRAWAGAACFDRLGSGQRKSRSWRGNGTGGLRLEASHLVPGNPFAIASVSRDGKRRVAGLRGGARLVAREGPTVASFEASVRNAFGASMAITRPAL